MTTAEAVEGMTDAGQFEILATRVLRRIDPDGEAVAHAGVNAQGKTIPNPIDGFCLVPNTEPPRYILTAFTLVAAHGLLEKWLFDHASHVPTPRRKSLPPTSADDGDLIKAGREAADIRARHPAAKFVVWLCTNRRLDNELQRPVLDMAATLAVEVRFLEQSRLRDFLDVEPEGQWLRQEHLGIEADQLSSSLLRKLSLDSRDHYADELLLPPVDQIVSTRAARTAADALRGHRSLHLLVGPSGAGKSVIAHDLLRGYTDAGGVGLWIPGEVADRAASLSDALWVVLRSLHPRIGPGAGHEALRLGTADHPLLLVVDDVNRSPDPIRLLRKVLGWSRSDSSGDGAIGGAVPMRVRLVCPVWDIWWHPLRHTYDSASWVNAQPIGPMARVEAVACLKAALGRRCSGFTDVELCDFAERLHDDPILLGLFGRILHAEPSVNPLSVCENVIGRVVDQSIGELASARHTLATDYLGALNHLSKEMIRKRSLHPVWSEVETWFESQPAVRDRLAQLAAQGHICRLTDAMSPPRLEFRHDRILEHHLAQAAAEMLSAVGGDCEVIADPFFIPFVGRAIARSPLSATVLDSVSQRNPSALIAAVPYLSSSPSTYADGVVEHARDWLSRADHSPDSMRYDALWTLARTSSPRILTVTQGIPGNRWIWEARFRNGDAHSGALALSRQFDPAVRHPWLESLIEQARVHHGPRLTADLRLLLRSQSITDRERSGALCLAGYLGERELAADVQCAWESASNTQDILLAALWAALRCSGDRASALLGPMLPHILDLEHDDSGQKFCARDSLLKDLGFASRHGYEEAALTYLADLGTAQEPYRWIVAALLDDVDHPVAIRYVVPLLAEAKHKAEQAGGFSPWAVMWGDRWNREENNNKARLTAASVSALNALVADPASPKWLQDFAFWKWARHVSDLSELQAVLPDCQHFDGAARHRAIRGDRTIIGYALGKIVTDDHWLRLTPHIWAADFEPAVEAALRKVAADPDVKAKRWFDQQFELSHLIRDIPPGVAERLLTNHWAGLGQCPLFIQAALYHDTPQCRELTADALSRTEPGDDTFKHIGSFFGFFMYGLADRLTRRHLDSLLPHLSRLDDYCIEDMLEYCRRHQHWDWAVAHLQPEMQRRAARIAPDSEAEVLPAERRVCRWFPTDDELLTELDQIERIDSRYRLGHLVQWWDNFVERDDPDDRGVHLLSEWLARAPSTQRFVFAVSVLTERGKRRHLDLLLKLTPEGTCPEITRAISDAGFAVRRRSLD